jgi:flagellar biosynthesis/type III secretory pathway M-ring protein FliF/YscJ
MLLAEKSALPSDISKTFTFDDIVQPKGFSMESDQEQQTRFNIALGNTLARCIATAPEIAKAQVLIGTSRDGYFGKEQATAAVYIQPVSPEPLPETKLAAICRFVAAGVGPKLSAKAVVVTNLVTGESFSLESDSSPYSRAANRIELQRNYDRYYQDAVEKFLSGPLGQVRTLVSVNWDASTRTTEETEYAVTKKSTNTSTTTGPAASGGDNLTSANVGASVTATAPAAQGSTSESSQTETTSEPSKKVATEIPPGQVVDVSLSVIADLARIEAIVRAKDKTIKDADPVPQATIDRECAAWKASLAAGLLKNPTSKVTSIEFSAAPFSKLPFQTAAAAPVAATSRALELFAANWHRIGLGLLALVALFMIRGVARRAEVESAEEQLPKPASEEEFILPEVELDMDKKRTAKMRENIEDMARTDPQTAASLVRRWMARES